MAGPTSASSTPSLSSSPTISKALQPTHVNHLVSVKLDAHNYLLWRAQFLPLLRGYRLMGFVDGTHPCPPRFLNDIVDNPAYIEWVEQDSILLGWLLSSLSDSILAQVLDYETSHAVWQAIQDSLASKSEARQMQLHRELQDLKKGDRSMQEYILRAKAVADQLVTTGNKISSSSLRQHILHGLEPSYDPIVTSLQTTMANMSFEDFQSHLLSYEIRLQSQQAISSTSASVHVAASTNRSPSTTTPPPSSRQQQYYPNRHLRSPLHHCYQHPPMLDTHHPTLLLLLTLILLLQAPTLLVRG
ncbi:hypothetical protein BVC80_8959g26 [Macleaya cordata]|uniref:Retrotransposon Copia-like N-terminal domain-containing protein n=1 Tax=Macleaya cordata TaxID=56857 RepID=A0A200QWX6_MACCD|nr:hypothetical protein BVC80_8959g26 [Macleaya cordata]